jgi:hypothetical protein
MQNYIKGVFMSVTFEDIDGGIIKRIDAHGNEIFIPINPHNGFYQRYLRWVETGNEFPQGIE